MAQRSLATARLWADYDRVIELLCRVYAMAQMTWIFAPGCDPVCEYRFTPEQLEFKENCEQLRDLLLEKICEAEISLLPRHEQKRRQQGH